MFFSAFYPQIIMVSPTLAPANILLTEPLTRKGSMVVGYSHRSPMPLQRPLVVHIGQC